MIMFRYKVIEVAIPLIYMVDTQTAERVTAHVKAGEKEAPVEVGDIVERDEHGKLFKGRNS